jgi:hypothetical protein
MLHINLPPMVLSAGFLFLFAACALAAAVTERSEVSQYNITWKFDKPYPAGQFVTGDWWVVGPVKIVSVSPVPGPAQAVEKYEAGPNQFGDVSKQKDNRMRNGSMVVLAPCTGQGFDSRSINYDPALSIAFPYVLEASRSLISTISFDAIPNPNFLKGHFEKSDQLLQTAAVLTCLDAAPPPNAFRPVYVGTRKTMRPAGSLRRDLLPKLRPLPGMPGAAEIARYFERPWLDFMPTWLRMTPQENNPSYGREFSRVTGFGACGLMLDLPAAEKEKLLIGYVQLGLDLYDLAQHGMQWRADGGHWAGRKLPILAAGLLLDCPEMLQLPDSIPFHEDTQTYYGKSFWGHTVLWQMVLHHGPCQPFEEKDPATYNEMDERSNSYRVCCNGHSWVGMALAARWLKLMAAWDHDAFFDYCDRWMDPREAEIEKKRPGDSAWCCRATDKWITELWQAYRSTAPQQPGARENKKWVWEGEKGKWVVNPKTENR